MIEITYTPEQIAAFNYEYEAEQRDIRCINYARKILSVYNEKSEVGQIADGKMHMDLIGKVIR